MDATSLGHACWLFEAAGLRLLCDPLIGVEHHGGVFEVHPRRRLRAEALRPDFIFVSHRHPDHFDIPSLARLAALDADSVLVTPDELVAWTAGELGFRNVKLLGAGQRVELDGLMLVTTASLAEDPEWGLMLADEHGVIWNQVDSAFSSPAHARELAARSLAALGAPRVDLLLAQWQPMHEIDAQLGRRVDFPYPAYAELLATLAAIDPAAIVPSAAGTAHAPAFDWLNRIVNPVDPARFQRDAAKACPRARVFPDQLGARYRLRRGELELELDPKAGAELIDPLPGAPSRLYRPTAIPELHDPSTAPPELLAERRRELLTWIERDLLDALVHAHPSFDHHAPLRFAVEAVFPHHRDARTLIIDAHGGESRDGLDPSWDAYNGVVGSMCWEVIAGRRHWGDLLLAGGLRAFTRAYSVSPKGLRRADVGETFLYYALSYDESIRRAVRWELGRSS